MQVSAVVNTSWPCEWVIDWGTRIGRLNAYRSKDLHRYTQEKDQASSAADTIDIVWPILVEKDDPANGANQQLTRKGGNDTDLIAKKLLQCPNDHLGRRGQSETVLDSVICRSFLLP